MTTPNELIKDALSDLGVRSLETNPTTGELSQGLRYLNRLASYFAIQGINVGFSRAEAGTDTLDIPDWAEDLFITHLALRLAPSFEVPVTPIMAGVAQEMFQTAQLREFKIPEAYLPTTLPTGEGNDDWDNSDFYRAEDPNSLYTGTNDNLSDDSEVDFSID